MEILARNFPTIFVTIKVHQLNQMLIYFINVILYTETIVHQGNLKSICGT